MYSALLISHTDKELADVSVVLRKSSIRKIDHVTSCGEARRKTYECAYDLYIINNTIGTENGESLALELVTTGVSQVIMIVKNEAFAYVSHKVEDAGVFTIPKPINKSLLYMALKLATASWARLQAMEKQKVSLRMKMEDMKIVARAKCILVAHLGMSENDAHRYIEKEAMNTRKSRREMAERILKIYE